MMHAARRLVPAIAALAVAGQAFAFGVAHAATTASSLHAAYHGTFAPSSISGTPTDVPTSSNEIPAQSPNSKTIRHTYAAGTPTVQALSVSSGQANGFGGFQGITHKEQRLAGTGDYSNTQFSLEPPDQGLCVGNGFLVETVNNAVRVFDTSGSPATEPIALSQFFGFKPEVVRPNGPFGPFISDPKCYFDVATSRWFLTELGIGQVPATGNFDGTSFEAVAVSTSSDPSADWNIYTFDTTDSAHPGCGGGCFGDQPLIGADAYGFYVSTNEYSIKPFGTYYNGAQVYAMSKQGLEGAGKNGVNLVHIDSGPYTQSAYGAPSFNLQPATVPGTTYDTSNGGTQYFVSSLDLGAGPALGTRATHVGLWALTNTISLNSKSPSLTLSFTAVASETYTQPPNMTQKKGPLWLGAQLNDPESLVASNDDRMNQVVYANGHLWSATNSAVKQQNGPTTTGIAWFEIAPSATPNSVSGQMTNQGYLAASGQNTAFPSIGVTDAGRAVMTFALVGPDFYPSAAYATQGADGSFNTIYVAGAGRFPEDGFTGYKEFGGTVARWGDYTAAVADGSGNVWMAAEFINDLYPPARTFYANWSTFVSKVTP